MKNDQDCSNAGGFDSNVQQKAFTEFFRFQKVGRVQVVVLVTFVIGTT